MKLLALLACAKSIPDVVCCSNSLARQVPWVSPGETGSALDKTGLLEFNKVFPDIVRDLTHTGRHLDVPRATKWFAKVIPFLYYYFWDGVGLSPLVTSAIVCPIVPSRDDR